MITMAMKSNKGFTLIESMIAVTILTFAVAGPLYTASRAFVAAEIARDKLTASYLAQEGVEYMRAMRDNEYLAAYQAGGASISSTAWNDFLNGTSAASITQCRAMTCTLDTYPTVSMGTGSGLSLNTCNTYSRSSCTPLYLANGVYTQQSGIAEAVKTPFTRTVQVKDVVDSSGVAVLNDKQAISTVSLSFHEIPYVVTVTDHLTPWQ